MKNLFLMVFRTYSWLQKQIRYCIFKLIQTAFLFVLYLNLANAAALCDLPPFSTQMQAMQHFYKFKLLKDCYPGREDGVAPPIYGTYILTDYLNQYKHNPSPELKTAINTVALAAIGRMSDFQGGLVFWYPANNVIRNMRRHYSGLTQAYYAVAFYRAYQVTQNDLLRIASEKAYKSLKIPASKGGVYYLDSYGVTIAEVPQKPNSWILNGWLSVLAELEKYQKLTQSDDARQLLTKNLQTLNNRIGLYNNPKYKISNYGLTGFSYIRLKFGKHTAIRKISDFKLTVPGEASYTIPNKGSSRWDSYYFSQDLPSTGIPVDDYLRLNLVLSKSSYPKPNVLQFVTNSAEKMTADIEVYHGEYAPTKGGQVNEKWVRLAGFEIKPGITKNTVKLPWGQITNEVIMPTNFMKVIDDENANVYHSIHIRKLNELYSKYRYSNYRYWASNWSKYVCNWPARDIYDGLYITPLTDMAPDRRILTPAEFCSRL